MESACADVEVSLDCVGDGPGGGVVAAQDLAGVGGGARACGCADSVGLEGVGDLLEAVDVLDGGGEADSVPVPDEGEGFQGEGGGVEVVGGLDVEDGSLGLDHGAVAVVDYEVGFDGLGLGEGEVACAVAGVAADDDLCAGLLCEGLG